MVQPGGFPAPRWFAAALRLALSTALATALTTALAAPLGAETAPAPEAGLPHAFDAGWQGQKTCSLLYEDEQVRVGRCAFPPGVGHEKHYHNPHFGYVLGGATMRITDADGTRDSTTTAGASWSTDRRTVHEALNIGDTTASYLIVEPRQGGQ